MTDLPKLKIGCGIRLDNTDRCGWEHITTREKELCETCQYNLGVVKAHAAAHHKKMVNAQFAVRRWYEKGARDAMLELAGLTAKDLEGK